MAEEQRCQEGHRPCINNCGFLGSPGTMDLCSKCYRDLRLKEDQASSAKIAVEKSLISPSPSPSPSPSIADVPSPFIPSLPDISAKPLDPSPTDHSTAPERCSDCRKKVGLTGFRCRCGLMFCGPHRYPEKHRCSFDYKTAGREAITRANPIVKAAKLAHKI